MSLLKPREALTLLSNIAFSLLKIIMTVQLRKWYKKEKMAVGNKLDSQSDEKIGQKISENKIMVYYFDD